MRRYVLKQFIDGHARDQATSFPECLEDWLDEDNPARAVNAFIDSLDLDALRFAGVDPKATGRPAYHPTILLKLYVYGDLNAVQSSDNDSFESYGVSERISVPLNRHAR